MLSTVDGMYFVIQFYGGCDERGGEVRNWKDFWLVGVDYWRCVVIGGVLCMVWGV